MCARLTSLGGQYELTICAFFGTRRIRLAYLSVMDNAQCLDFRPNQHIPSSSPNQGNRSFLIMDERYSALTMFPSSQRLKCISCSCPSSITVVLPGFLFKSSYFLRSLMLIVHFVHSYLIHVSSLYCNFYSSSHTTNGELDG